MRPSDEFTNTGIQAFLEAYPDAIAIHREGTLLYVNRAGLNLVGAQSPEDVIGRSMLDFVHPDSRDDVLRRMQETANGQPADLIGEQFVTLKGVALEVEAVSLPIDLQRGRATQLIIRDVTEVRRVEAENRRLEQEAATALRGHRFTQEALDLAESAAGLGVWDWALESGDLRWTKGLEPLHGMSPGTFNGTFEHFLEAVYEDDRPALLATIEQTLRDGEEFETRFRIPEGDGFRWILGKGRAYRDADGRPVRMVGIGLDITERTSVEMALAESENLFRLVTSLLPANVAYIDRHEYYRFANETYRSWYGIDPATVVGQSAREFMGEAYSRMSPALQQALAGEASELEIEIDEFNGRTNIHARFVPDLGPEGKVHGVVGLFSDVTAQRLASDAIKARSRCEQLLNGLGAALQGETDAAGVARAATGLLVEDFARVAAIDRVSGGISERLAFQAGPGVLIEPDELALPSCESVPTGPLEMESFEMALRPGPAIGRRVWIPLPDNCAVVLTLLDAQPGFSPDEDELLVEIGESLRGAFERAALFDRLQLALAARDDFIGFTTHELKTPLTVMLGFAEILSRRAGDLQPDEVSEMAATLLREARRLEGIVENMLHLARAERGSEDEPTLLHRVAETVFGARNWLSPERQKRLTVQGSPGMVMAPTGWIEHLIDNLLSNAEKYSDALSPVDVEVFGDPGTVTLRVLDRGRGVTEEQAETLFEPFFRANPTEPGVPGIGLGLTVCRKLVDRLGGRIWLRPRGGGGTEAGFCLPVVATLE